MSNLYDKINNDILVARKSRNTVVANVLGTLKGQLQTISDGKPSSLDETRIIKEIKSMCESISETIRITGNKDSNISDKLKIEMDTLSIYLPKMMTDEEISHAVSESISKTGATTKADLGNVMKELRVYGPSLDMKKASELVKASLV